MVMMATMFTRPVYEIREEHYRQTHTVSLIMLMQLCYSKNDTDALVEYLSYVDTGIQYHMADCLSEC